MLVWTRVTTERDEAVDVRWTVARDPALRDVVAAGRASAAPDHDHTVTVDARGLEPATVYHYGFEALGARSPVGRTRTAPRGQVERIRFAVASCAKYTAGYFNVYRLVAARDDLDFLLHLGDYIYEYPQEDGKAPGAAIGRVVDPPHECTTLADYRRRYRCYREDPDVQRLHARLPLVAIIDDHEICDNTWRDGAKKHDGARDGPWDERKAAALRAWREWMPSRLPDPADPHRFHRTLPLGDLADLVLLDGRTRRDEQTKGEALRRPDRSLLGGEQYGWLTRTLAASRARWRLVGNAVMIGQVYTGFLPEELGDPLSELGILTETDHGPDPDQWDGYPAERERLFRFLEDERIVDLVFLSGDVHTAWAVDLSGDPRHPDNRPVAVELVTPSITSENIDEETRDHPRAVDSKEVERRVIEENPHVRWVDLDLHGFVVVDVTAERTQAQWVFTDGVRERSDRALEGPSWVVRAGEARLRRAEQALPPRPLA